VTDDGPLDDWELEQGGPVRDPGVARERTELAWNRSGLAVLAVLAVTIRNLWPLDGARSVVALVLIAAGALVWAVGMALARATRTETEPVLGSTVCRLVMTGTVILAVAGLGVSIFLPG
jgi:uncharacterized membrane protein YidH (DUF202 family)